ncbi:MAG: competence/damage-inducible protein A [bacterium]
MKAPCAIVVASGSELLTGLRTDTNTRFVARALRSIGIHVVRTLIVGDSLDELVDVFSISLERAEILIVSGGLGPTVDDLTREALSEATGIRLAENETALQEIAARFRSLNRQMTDNNRRQALVPVSGTFFSNPHGTAPGLVFEFCNRLAIALPGPPRELQPMVENHLVPLLNQRFPDLPHESSVIVRFVGTGESNIDQTLRESVTFDPRIRVSLLARLGLVDLTLYLSTDEHCYSDLLRESQQRVLDVLGEFAYATEEIALEEVLGKILLERGETLATAESCTGGLVGGGITSIPGSSRYYLGGFVTYSNEAKVSQLGVRPETLETYGAVSEETAREMAVGGARAMGADWCVSVTGIAGPEGGTPDKPVGTVWIGVASPRRGRASAKRHQFFGDRAAVRERTRVAALDELRKAIV